MDRQPYNIEDVWKLENMLDLTMGQVHGRVTNEDKKQIQFYRQAQDYARICAP